VRPGVQLASLVRSPTRNVSSSGPRFERSRASASASKPARCAASAESTRWRIFDYDLVNFQGATASRDTVCQAFNWPTAKLSIGRSRRLRLADAEG